MAKKIVFALLCVMLVASVVVVPGTAAPEPSPPIKLGGLCAKTGIVSVYGRSTEIGWLKVIDEINAAGGVLGRKLEIIITDNESSAERTATLCKRLIVRDKVCFVLTGVFTPVGLAAAEACTNLETPTISAAAYAEKLSRPVRKWVYQYGWVVEETTAAYLKRAKASSFTRVAHLAVNNAFGLGIQGYVKKLCPEYGLTYVGGEAIEPGSTEAGVQVLKLKNLNPDCVIISIYEPEAAAFARARATLKFDVPCLWSPGVLEEGYRMAGIGIPDGDMGYAVIDTRRPDVKKVIAEATEMFGDFKALTGAFDTAYSSMKVVAEAIKRAGSTDKEAIRAAMDTIKDFPVLTGPAGYTITFSPTDHAGMERHAASFFRYIGGKPEYID